MNNYINLGANGEFSVDNNGYLVSKYGKIGGFNITESSIYNSMINLGNIGLTMKYNEINVGNFGTNTWEGRENVRGLVTEIEYDTSYIVWGQNDGGNTYNAKLLYVGNGFGEYNGGTLHMFADLNLHGWRALDFWINPYGREGVISGVLDGANYDGYVCIPTEVDASTGNISAWINVKLINGFLVAN